MKKHSLIAIAVWLACTGVAGAQDVREAARKAEADRAAAEASPPDGICRSRSTG